MNLNDCIKAAFDGTPAIYDPSEQFSVTGGHCLFLADNYETSHSPDVVTFAKNAWVSGTGRESILITEWFQGMMLVASGTYTFSPKEAAAAILDGKTVFKAGVDVDQVLLDVQANREKASIDQWRSAIVDDRKIVLDGLKLRIGSSAEYGAQFHADMQISAHPHAKPFNLMACTVQTTPSSRRGGEVLHAKGFYRQWYRRDEFFVIVGNVSDGKEGDTRRLKLEPGEVEWIEVNGVRVY